MPRRQDNPYAPHDWAPHEKPALLGSPSTPLHSPAKRLAYGVVGLLVCLTGALGNGERKRTNQCNRNKTEGRKQKR